jgi:hypothetical protein
MKESKLEQNSKNEGTLPQYHCDYEACIEETFAIILFNYANVLLH